MPARNHVEAANARKNRSKPKQPEYMLRCILAGGEVNDAAKVLLRRLAGAIDSGDLTLAGSEDMAQAVRDGLVDLQKAVRLFDHYSLKINP